MNKLGIVTFCLAAFMFVGGVSAHEDFRIIGTVAKVTDTTLDVKQTKDGKIIAMRMSKTTVVTRDKKKVDRAELKVGAHVVADARGDSLKDLWIREVRLVPPPATTPSK